MPETKTSKRFALTLLAVVYLTPVGPVLAAPGDSLGDQFLVNTTTADDQGDPAVAMDADGDFVVAWHSCPADADGLPIRDGCDVFAQRYDAAGTRQGGEFLVHTTAGQAQLLPDVAMDADGNFVVVWWGYGPGGGYGIFARRFTAAGEPQGPEFQVNTTDSPIEPPSVAMDADGDFVVAWAAAGYGLVFQRYDAAGKPQGGEFVVMTPSYGSVPWDPIVAMDAAGNFVVAWEYYRYITGKRFDAGGVAQSDWVQFHSSSSYDLAPAIAMDAAGNFVVAWGEFNNYGESVGVFAQRFDASGELTWITPSLGKGRPDVAMDGDGDVVVTWTGAGAGGVWGVHGQLFSAAGEPQGGEFRVNLYPTTTAAGPSVAMDADGDFVVTWLNWDGDGDGVFAQRFDGAERAEGDFDGDGKGDVLWRNVVTGNAVIWLMDGETRRAAGSIGTVPTSWKIAGTGDFNGDGKADILWRNSSTGNAVVWQMNGLEKAAAGSIGAVPAVWTVEQLRDANGDGLSDILWRNTETGTTMLWHMSGFTRVAADPIGSVNSDWQVR